MAYTTSREVMRELNQDAKFKDDISHYNYQCWTVNKANCKSDNPYYEIYKYYNYLASNMLL